VAPIFVFITCLIGLDNDPLQIIGTTSMGIRRAEITPVVPNLDIISGGNAEEGYVGGTKPRTLSNEKVAWLG
jgi:hypothetical protein